MGKEGQGDSNSHALTSAEVLLFLQRKTQSFPPSQQNDKVWPKNIYIGSLMFFDIQDWLESTGASMDPTYPQQ